MFIYLSFGRKQSLHRRIIQIEVIHVIKCTEQTGYEVITKRNRIICCSQEVAWLVWTQKTSLIYSRRSNRVERAYFHYSERGPSNLRCLYEFNFRSSAVHWVYNWGRGVSIRKYLFQEQHCHYRQVAKVPPEFYRNFCQRLKCGGAMLLRV